MADTAIGPKRYRLEIADTGERMVIPAWRNVLLVLFLVIWLAGWTFGGTIAVDRLIAEASPLVALWLIGWAFGLGWVIAWLSWMLTGQETVRMVGGDLEIGYFILGIRITRLYKGSGVKRLKALAYGGPQTSRKVPPMPIFGQWRGSVQFSYEAQTKFFGFGVSQTQAEEIVEWLRKRLPDA